MLRNKKIAFFIDVDNVVLKSEQYIGIVEQLNAMGKILYGKIYGAGERKHKEIYADAAAHNYDTDRQMRVKRRGRKDFDNRIFVDVVDAVAKAPSLDAVCIVAQPTDMVYLYSYLRRRGISVVALDNVDEQSREFIDEFISLGVVEDTPPKSKPQKAADTHNTKVEQPAPKKEQPKQPEQNGGVDRTEELLREIARLQALANDEQKAPVEEKPIEEPAEEPVEQPVEQSAAAEEQPAPKAPAKPRAQYTSQNDSDLIRRIEELRRNNEGGDPDDLLEEIRKLLDIDE